CCAGELGRLTVTNGVPGLVYVPAGNEGTLEGFQGRLSEMLTVWRRLHVELDSMNDVSMLKTANYFVATIAEIIEQEGRPVRVRVTQNLGGLDTSPNLSVGGGNGRFQNGHIAFPNLVYLVHAETDLDGNGTNFLHKAAGFNLPFTIITNGVVAASGTVRRLNDLGNSKVLRLQTNDPLSTNFEGHQIDVAGSVATIEKVLPGPKRVRVPASYVITCAVHDDDSDLLLPKLPNMELASTALAQAYVAVRLDTPAVAVHSATNSEFVANVSRSTVLGSLVSARWGSRTLNANDFWVAFVYSAFQGPTYTNSFLTPPDWLRFSDRDPNSEGRVLLGVTRAGHVGGSLVFAESIRDGGGGALPYTEAGVVTHELGHAVGRSDLHVTTVTGGTTNLVGDGVINSSGYYLPEYLDAIRSVLRPAGP
ncbi:MAG: hypothetical protein NZ483_05865, partial [Verrucomicrobiae bacterium]|nr:hypothetical protein [Verrucomicrobiae bacterium]